MSEKKSWAISWYDSKSASSITVLNKTRAEAQSLAEEFGYIKPKWWEIFKRRDFQFEEINQQETR